MAQKVREIMTSAPVALRPSQPLTKAGRAMRDQGVGSVLVVDNGQLNGRNPGPATTSPAASTCPSWSR